MQVSRVFEHWDPYKSAWVCFFNALKHCTWDHSGPKNVRICARLARSIVLSFPKMRWDIYLRRRLCIFYDLFEFNCHGLGISRRQTNYSRSGLKIWHLTSTLYYCNGYFNGVELILFSMMLPPLCANKRINKYTTNSQTNRRRKRLEQTACDALQRISLDISVMWCL